MHGEKRQLMRDSGKGQQPKQCSSTKTSHPHPFNGNYEEE